MTLVEHLEFHLGEVYQGFGDESAIQVVCFADQPEAGVLTYATLGLSEVVLPMPSGRAVRQELLVSVSASYSRKAIASFLLSFAEYIVAQNRALLRGDVVGPSGPIISGAAARAVYSAMPVFFDEEFATFRGTSPPTVMVWLIPLLPGDADYVKANGWGAFEEKLEAGPVNFWDLDRPVLS